VQSAPFCLILQYCEEERSIEENNTIYLVSIIGIMYVNQIKSNQTFFFCASYDSWGEDARHVCNNMVLSICDWTCWLVDTILAGTVPSKLLLACNIPFNRESYYRLTAVNISLHCIPSTNCSIYFIALHSKQYKQTIKKSRKIIGSSLKL